MRDAMGKEVTGWSLVLGGLSGMARAAAIIGAYYVIWLLLPDAAQAWIFDTINAAADWTRSL